MVDRIASYAQTNAMAQQNMRLQSKNAELSAQVSSGRKAETYGGMAEDSEQTFRIESSIAKLETTIANTQTALDRVEVMYDAVNGILERLDSMMSDLSAAISGDQITDAELQDAATQIYESIADALNTEMGGRYLFGGANTTTPPVDLNDPLYPNFTAPSTADTSYYQGDGTIQSVVAGDNYRIDYGVTADAAGFEEALRALNLLINNPGDDATRDEAFTLLESAQDAITTIAHGLSVDATALETRQSEHESAKTFLENMASDLKSVDLTVASTELSQSETQLEAAYSATATILKLSLLDYLN